MISAWSCCSSTKSSDAVRPTAKLILEMEIARPAYGIG